MHEVSHYNSVCITTYIYYNGACQQYLWKYIAKNVYDINFKMPCAYILIFEKVPIFFHYYLVLEQVIKKVGKYGFRKCQITQIGQGHLWVMHGGHIRARGQFQVWVLLYPNTTNWYCSSILVVYVKFCYIILRAKYFYAIVIDQYFTIFSRSCL